MAVQADFPCPTRPRSALSYRLRGAAASPQRARVLSALAERRVAAASPTKNSLARSRPRNPFIEYDVREKRLKEERSWLQEDEAYLRERQEDLRHGSRMKNMAQRADSAGDLYEKRMYYGPHSMRLRNTRRSRSGAIARENQGSSLGSPTDRACERGGQPPSRAAGGGAAAARKLNSGSKGAACAGINGADLQAALSMRRLRQELLESCCTEVQEAWGFAKPVVEETRRQHGTILNGIRSLYRAATTVREEPI